MTKKIFGANAISHLIYGLLMLFPFLSILARSAYVTINKNAYESYGGQVESVTTDSLPSYLSTDTISTTNYKTGYSYYENVKLNTHFYSNKFTGNLGSTEFIFNVDNFSLNGVLDSSIKCISISYGNTTTMYLNTFTIRWDESTVRQTVYRYSVDGNNYTSTHSNLSLNNNVIEFDFVNNRLYNPSNSFSFSSLNSLSALFTNVVYYSSTLDNAFDYSVKKFVENDNIGQLNLFQFFDGMFVNRDGVTGLYINFANWYLNYALLVSCVYILFLVLLWFVNFARKLLDGRNSFGHGGF